MDAHVFRRFATSLAPILEGARLEKIQSPAEHVFVLTFYANKRKQHLILKSSRRAPFIYIAKERPVATAPPTAPIMRMRKYCAGRRIASCAVDWLNRKLLLLFRTNIADDASPETWLVLDLRNGPMLVLGSCPDLPVEDDAIAWPEKVNISETSQEDWRDFPVLTPILRRTLSQLDELDAKALLMDLQMGGGDLFVYGQDMQAQILAWPLPLNLADGQNERIFEDPIEATSCIGDALVLGAAAQKVRNVESLPHKRQLLRLTKLLEKLEDEELRLNKLTSMQEHGLALQNIMWQHDPHTKLSSIETENSTLELDPRYTLSENMQRFFHKAGRGRRGLQYLDERKAHIKEQLSALQNSVNFTETIEKKHNKDSTDKPSLLHANLPRGVEAFHSVDNFVILRGKDAKGNWAALRLAAAQDLWLHVEGGPGAHCIVRRHFAGQDIPQTTVDEAARLAATKSWQKDSPYAQIICAEVRHVKPMRNAAAGTVRIDKVWRSFRVALTDA